ncbi:MAG: helix-turn-helix domain-containing protein [Pyrinomonadaceae bacterium]
MDYRVELAIALMKEDLRRKLSLSTVAQAANLSVSRLQHLFRAETGMTLIGYRRLLRIERARDLLATTPLSIKQIRISVGMDDRRHFEREFKKVCEVTPTEYRAAFFASVKELH